MITRAKLSSVLQGLPKYRSMLAGNSAYQPVGYYSIASATPSGTSSVTFSSIPNTYDHLQLRITSYFVSAGGGSSQMKMRFNGDSGSNYWYHQLNGNGTSASATASDDTSCIIGRQLVNDSLSIPTVFIVDIHNYKSSTQNKTIRSASGYQTGSSGQVYLMSNLWLNTSAISSIEIFNPTFQAGSSFALYGLKGA
jgi:hypothetical protein